MEKCLCLPALLEPTTTLTDPNVHQAAAVWVDALTAIGAQVKNVIWHNFA